MTIETIMSRDVHHCRPDHTLDYAASQLHYLAIPNDRNRYEILDGDLPVSPVPSFIHQKVLANLFFILMSHVREHRLGDVVCAPIDVVLAETTVVQPDIVFAPREPGVSVVECVTAAVNKVVSMGAVDAAKIGVMGHSWGGFHAMYLATHSKLFASAVSGAGISNLISNYGNHHWSSGIAETDHIETGQQRMQVPLYEDLQAYIRNSAIYTAHTMQTPLLVMFGENDGTVHWHQGVALYNIARRVAQYRELFK